MKFDRSDLKTIGLNFLCSLFFQIFLSLIPSFSITAFLKYILDNFLSLDKYLFYSILIIFFISLEVVVLFIIRKLINRKTTVDDENTDNNEEDEIVSQEEITLQEDEYNTLDYYFADYHKKLTVYKNGNGIIIHSFNLIINDINSITQFKRELNIEDAKISTNFPSLMLMTPCFVTDLL